MRKRALYEYTKDPKVHQSIDSIIMSLASEYKSDDLEADIIALFEHIVAFFSGREEDFINLNSMSPKQKEALYTEIRLIIEILKKLKFSIDKQETIKILSKNLIKTFSKSSLKTGYVIDQHDIFTIEEQEKIKQEFIKITMEIFRKQRLEFYKSTPAKLEKKSVTPQSIKNRPQTRGASKGFNL